MERVINFAEKYVKTDLMLIFKGGIWLVSSEAIAAVVSVSILAAFANWASQETFGAYQFVFSVVTIAGVFSLPGINQALTRSVAKGKEGSLLSAFKAKFLFGTFGLILILLASLWYFLNDNFTLAISFLVIAPFFQLAFSTEIFQSFWRGKKRFDVSFVCRSATGIVVATALIVAIFFTDKLWILLAVFFSVSAIVNGLFFLFSYRRRKNDEVDYEMDRFGKNLTAMNFLEKISLDIDNVILWTLFGPAQVVIYTLAAKPIEKSRLFIPVKELALPILSENGISNKGELLKKFLWLFALTIPSAIILAVLAPFLYSIIFPKYVESVKYFRFLTILIATLPFGVLVSALIAEMKTKYLYITKLTEPIVKITLLLILAPIFGIWGVVWAFLIADIARDIIGTYLFWKM